MKKILTYLFFLLALVTTIQAQGKTVPADSSRLELRRLPDATLRKYLADEDFNYKQSRGKSLNLWARFWAWLSRQIRVTDDNDSGSWSVFGIIRLVVCVAIIIYAILKFTGMSGIGLFTRNKKSEPLKYEVSEEDIYAIDFPKMIAEAAVVKNYRLAIRLLYLQTLRKLADGELIRWKINKTNDTYVQELYGGKYYETFSWLTRTYDYVWYGHFSVQEQQFKEAQQHFQTFQQQLTA
ncbi:MAG: DUF4129 domain-containing protein [Bacteroidetes bacterium]|nr:DUF4129 domain-containing protein [Bacteroidota bacterium]